MLDIGKINIVIFFVVFPDFEFIMACSLQRVELDQTILTALFKSEHLSSAEQLSLALTWNRALKPGSLFHKTYLNKNIYIYICSFYM